MCKKEYPINEKSDIPFLYIRCGMTHTSVDKNNTFSKKSLKKRQKQKVCKLQTGWNCNLHTLEF